MITIRCVAPGCAKASKDSPFCKAHAKAPPGQRGGWLSAAKRKPYDANAIAPRLWIGAVPPFDRELSQVDLLVLCAAELQPERMAFRGRVLRCPIPDGDLNKDELEMVIMSSVMVAQTVRQGQRALVTCAQGINRSSLVAALALGQLTTMSSDQIIAHIRKHRSPKALYNQNFHKIIHDAIGDGRRRASRRPGPPVGTE